jgi:transcriptional regulator with XRE-family HTH domain
MSVQTRDPDEVYTALGEELRTARVLKHELQDDVAHAIGIGRATVANIEAARHRLRLDRFLDWCDYLGVDPACIITRVRQQTAPRLPDDSEKETET